MPFSQIIPPSPSPTESIRLFYTSLSSHSPFFLFFLYCSVTQSCLTLCFTISQSLLKLTSIGSVMPSNHLILCHPLFLLPQSFPASESFPRSQLFASGEQSIGASPSALVLPMIIHCWFPLGLTGLISLLSRGLSKVFSSTTIGKHQFFSAQPSLWSNCHIHTWLLEKP